MENFASDLHFSLIIPTRILETLVGSDVKYKTTCLIGNKKFGEFDQTNITDVAEDYFTSTGVNKMTMI